MKLRELIDKLRQIDSEHANAEIRFETVEHGGNVVTHRVAEFVGVEYGAEGSDYCMMSVGDPISAGQLIVAAVNPKGIPS